MAHALRPSGARGFLAGNLILRLSFVVAGNARIFGLASSETFCASGHTQDEAGCQIFVNKSRCENHALPNCCSPGRPLHGFGL